MASPRLIAHRGYALRYPENTLASVEAAIAAGARFVEIDVQLSSDRVPFLMHDRTLERMCGVRGSIAEHTSAEIARLRASESAKFASQFADEPVASLAGFVDVIAQSGEVTAFVEIKRAALEVFGAPAVLEAVLPAIEPIRERAALISFDVGVLAAARARSQVRIGPVLIDWKFRESDAIAALRPDFVFCDLEKLPPEGRLSAFDAELAVYEVDRRQVALDLAARGVDMIETFQIREMLEALAPR
jgi:glycerophosphoryl diester phosphodiesterase